MKKFTLTLLLLSHSLAWANSPDASELGHSLANYQACSNAALEINDEQLFFYYKKMFNDAGLLVLSFDKSSAKQVYRAWETSEDVLLKIGGNNLQGICVSRFDALSRTMLNNIATP